MGRKRKNHKKGLGVFLKGSKMYGVKNVHKLFGDVNFCPFCVSQFKTGYDHKEKCPLRCADCCHYGYNFPCEENAPKTCEDCNRTFMSEECYGNHKCIYGSGKHEYTICNKIKCCPMCAEIYRTDKVGKLGHICGKKFCYNCKEYHARVENCPKID